MSRLQVDDIFLDSRMLAENGTYEFIVDCDAVYFGAVYDGNGNLIAIDQYFFTKDWSRDALADANDALELLNIDFGEFPVDPYLLTKERNGKEWLRFHAVVPKRIDTEYFYEKYIGD